MIYFASFLAICGRSKHSGCCTTAIVSRSPRLELVLPSRTRPSHTWTVRSRLVIAIPTVWASHTRIRPTLSTQFIFSIACQSGFVLSIALCADNSTTAAPLNDPHSDIVHIAAHRPCLVPHKLLSHGKYWPSLRSSSWWRKSSSMDERLESGAQACFANRMTLMSQSTSHFMSPAFRPIS
jgi:hypothetical protein